MKRKRVLIPICIATAAAVAGGVAWVEHEEREARLRFELFSMESRLPRDYASLRSYLVHADTLPDASASYGMDLIICEKEGKLPTETKLYKDIRRSLIQNNPLLKAYYEEHPEQY